MSGGSAEVSEGVHYQESGEQGLAAIMLDDHGTERADLLAHQSLEEEREN